MEFVSFLITDLDLENVHGLKVYSEASQILILSHFLYEVIKV
jgi:hypothetical protein